MKADVIDVFDDFYRPGSFVKAINTTFLVLIHKVEGANDIKDFRLISLVGCICKLISKVLARRMSRVLGEVVGESQMHLWREDKFLMQ